MTYDPELDRGECEVDAIMIVGCMIKVVVIVDEELKESDEWRS